MEAGQSPNDMANGMGWTAETHDTPAGTTAVQTRKDTKGRMMQQIKSTLLAEQKTMRALRSKMHQTKNLLSNLENTLDATEHELAKMQECKERLTAERARVSVNLEINTDRRQFRAQRPGRECVNDMAHKQLASETLLLEDIGSKLSLLLEEVEDTSDHLGRIKWLLAADLADKNAALEVDNQCTDLGSRWPEGPVPGEDLPSVSLKQVPTTWKVNTMQTVELAVQQHQEANNLRVKVAKVTLNAQLAEKIQYDLVQQAVEKRVATVGRLKKEVEIKLQQVTQEVMDVTTTKHRLEESVALKGPPLQITWQRYRARSQRPERELVHDEVEHALKEQYEALHASLESMKQQLSHVTAHLGEVLKIQADLDTNVADKIETIEMDRHCYAMAPPRPTTRGVLLGWHPVSEQLNSRESHVTWDTCASTKLMSY